MISSTCQPRPTSRSASLFAVTTRVEDLATDAAVIRRVETAERQVTAASHRDLRDLLAANRLESFSVLQVRRGNARLVFQGDTAWTRGMLYLLTGRSD